MDAEKASQVLQRLQVLEQAATEQLSARLGAERALVEALRPGLHSWIMRSSREDGVS